MLGLESYRLTNLKWESLIKEQLCELLEQIPVQMLHGAIRVDMGKIVKHVNLKRSLCWSF